MESESEKVTRWVKEVLENRNYEKIVVEFPGYDTSGGYAAEVVFVNVTAEKDGKTEKLELFVKKNKDNIAILNTLGMSQAYENETIIYKKIIPLFRELAEEKNSEIFQNIPPCYGTICRENEYIIVMENLKAKGFTTHDLEKTMDLPHLKLVLEAYGKWHAFSLVVIEKNRENFNKLKDNAKFMREGKLFGLMIKSWNNEFDWLIQEYTTKNKPKLIEKIQLLKKITPDLYADALKDEDKECVVLRHGDSWNNNFLFHYVKEGVVPDKAIVIDWQVCLLGSPTVDLVNFIFMNSSREELEHLDELLKFYHEIFSRKFQDLGGDPEKSLPWDKFMESFKHFAPVGIAMLTLAAKMSNKVETGEKYDIAQSIEDGDFSGVFGTTFRDIEGCIQRISDILEYCIEHKYL